ncbi:MAG: DUF1015 family protein [Coriobacteriia bacterium]|nr:DUF1015 family protein [Coriobacteriia bacterium]
MAHVVPFANYRPTPENAAEYAALPYDVFSRAEAAAEIEAHPTSFLRIDKTAALMPPAVDEYDARVYVRARELLDLDEKSGALVPEADGKPHYYVYRLIKDQHAQTGIVACVSADDYQKNVIKRHENTRTEKRHDRVAHIKALGAHTGPVLLAYRPHERIDAEIERACASEPLFDFTAPDGVQHTVWRIDDETAAETIKQAFSEINALYIADGHHRAAAAALVGEQEGGEATRFLAVLFSSEQLAIFDYNRVVFDLNGHGLEEFLRLVGDKFELSEVAREESPYRPEACGVVGMYVQGTWYRLEIPETLRPQDPVLGLDVSVLQDFLLDPILDIDDPRSSKRIAYVGGVRGLKELERRADACGGVSFALYPCSLDELFAVADAGKLMPPKSTWFEPKPRSGLFVHKI